MDRGVVASAIISLKYHKITVILETRQDRPKLALILVYKLILPFDIFPYSHEYKFELGLLSNMVFVLYIHV